MSIINVKENYKRRTLIRAEGSLKMTRVFTVLFDGNDDPSNEPLLANTASGVPHYGDAHPFNQYIYVKQKNVTVNEEAPHYYEVAVTYSNATLLNNDQETPVNPLSQPDEISRFFFSSEEKIDRGIDGKPITNSAGETSDPPLTETKYDLGVRIIQNKSSFDENQAADYIGTINNSNFRGHSAGTVRCTDRSAAEAWAGNQKYYRVTTEFRIRKKAIDGEEIGWKRRILDEGYRILAPTVTPKFLAIKDPDGNRPSEPVKLNGRGGMWVGDDDEGYWLTFETIEKRDLNVLV